jgi:succinylglutamate desuccinylase
MFNQFDHLPDNLLQAGTEDLLELLSIPTLIHLEGDNKQPLFISTLLHGNETTGFYAIQKILQRYADTGLPRSLSIFIGNVEAAATQQRRLQHQPDYNRIWPGTSHSQCIETDIMQTVTNIMRSRKPFASIDIHNNTGRNPHYACVNILSAHSLQLASLFTDITVYFTSPKGVQSSAFADFCPAVVLECGQSSDNTSVEHAASYLDKLINLETIPGDNPQGLCLYHTVARVTVPEQFSISTDADTDIVLNTELEDKNFTELQTGLHFAGLKQGSDAHLNVHNESNENVTDEFFTRDDNRLLLNKTVTLSMYTNDERAIRQDCLCYLMERLHFQA